MNAQLEHDYADGVSAIHIALDRLSNTRTHTISIHGIGELFGIKSPSTAFPRVNRDESSADLAHRLSVEEDIIAALRDIGYVGEFSVIGGYYLKVSKL